MIFVQIKTFKLIGQFTLLKKNKLLNNVSKYFTKNIFNDFILHCVIFISSIYFENKMF